MERNSGLLALTGLSIAFGLLTFAACAPQEGNGSAATTSAAAADEIETAVKSAVEECELGCLEPAVEPALSLNAVMVALVDHSAHELWDLGREGGAPVTEKDWQEVEHHAVQLAISGTAITAGGTGPSDDGWVRQLPWQQQARLMTDAAMEGYAGAQARDLERVLRAGDSIIAACEACHQEYKPEMPSEGIHHPH